MKRLSVVLPAYNEELMGLGLCGVFLALILFYALVKGLLAICKRREKKASSQ